MRVIYIGPEVGHQRVDAARPDAIAHPAVFSAGEVLKLNRQLRHQPSAQTEFRALLLRRALALAMPGLSRVDARTRETIGESLTDLDMLDYGETAPGKAPNAVVLRAIADVTGKTFVVNSSEAAKASRLSDAA